MRAPVSTRIMRTLLAVCVSLWMAGAGCMLGCSSTAHAAVQNSEQQTVIAGPSCHSSGHDCCAKKKQTTVDDGVEKSAHLLPLLSAMPEGLMRDCPLAINASAVTASKVAHNPPDQVHTSATELRRVDPVSRWFDGTPIAVYSLTRGPTYLRCCVFLI